MQIFVDDLEQVKSFLSFVIDTIGANHPKELEQLTTINLYHRMIEYLLYSKQMSEKSVTTMISSQGQSKRDELTKQITDFIVKHDQKIDKNYILFLFQIYNFDTGVKICCEKLDLKQELLNYYIQHDDRLSILKLCIDATKQTPSSSGDLWIQALTFFRDIPDITQAQMMIQ